VTERGGVKKRTAETVFGVRNLTALKLREGSQITGAPNDGSKVHIFLIALKDRLFLYVYTTEYGSRLTKVFAGFLRGFFQKAS